MCRESLSRFPWPRILVLCLLVCWASAAAATDVTLVLVDQHNNPISGSTFVLNKASVPQQGTVNVPPGQYTLLIRPGIVDKAIGGGVLERQETVNVADIPQTLRFVWKMSAITVSLVDQGDELIANSQIRIGSYGPGGKFDFATVSSGTTVRLPVTEDPDAPVITGMAANGYAGRLLPGIREALNK